MLQQEVVDRLNATPGDKNYSRLSVMTQYYCQTKKCFEVLPTAFYPIPKVKSALIALTPHRQNPYLVPDQDYFATIVKCAFQQRRKTIANNLKKLIDKMTLKKIGINPAARPQELDIPSYIKITNDCLLRHYPS